MNNRTYDLEERLIEFVLKIIKKKPFADVSVIVPVHSENEELIAIFAKSSKTAKSNLSK